MLNSKRVAEKKLEKIVIDIKKEYLEDGVWKISHSLPEDVLEYLKKWRKIQDTLKGGGRGINL